MAYARPRSSWLLWVRKPPAPLSATSRSKKFRWSLRKLRNWEQFRRKLLLGFGRVQPIRTDPGLSGAAGGPKFATRLLVKAFGEDTAENVLQKMVRLQELSVGQLDSLQKADPQQLAKFLEGEHPQTIALILRSPGRKQASALLMKLPEQFALNR